MLLLLGGVFAVWVGGRVRQGAVAAGEGAMRAREVTAEAAPQTSGALGGEAALLPPGGAEPGGSDSEGSGSGGSDSEGLGSGGSGSGGSGSGGSGSGGFGSGRAELHADPAGAGPGATRAGVAAAVAGPDSAGQPGGGGVGRSAESPSLARRRASAAPSLAARRSSSPRAARGGARSKKRGGDTDPRTASSMRSARRHEVVPLVPSRKRVLAALTRVKPRVRSCVRPEERGYMVKLEVQFASSGRVRRSEVKAPHVSAAARSCMARAARRARVPPFRKAEGIMIEYPMQL